MLTRDFHLAEAGYVFDDILRIWRRPAAERFAYSDGDEIEQALASVLREAKDLSLLSPELAAQCTDWPRRYHLSAARANLLRPLSNRISGDILEIGSGCGAITRFLGECGANVLALEGSQRRASITALRARDLPNVTVLNDRFDGFSLNRKFDVVTLIGVLEYAGLFSTENDPVHSMLQSIRGMLKPDGVLIVAIENQLGLKYFAGAPEDHVGVPMFGIHGLYQNPGVQTFGRLDFERRFHAAGFASTELALPFPDYKLPVAIVSPEGWSTPNTIDVGVFASQTVTRDAQIDSTVLTFALERAWQTIRRNGLLADLANSFLFVASPAQPVRPAFRAGELAYRYSVNLQPAYCSATTFVARDQGSQIQRQLLSDVAASLDDTYAHVIDDESYIAGTTLEENFRRVVLTPGWTIRQFAGVANQYVEALIAVAGGGLGHAGGRGVDDMLPGEMLDVMPRNIVIGDDGNAHVIAQEWTSRSPLPLGYLVFRAITLVLQSVSTCALPDDRRCLSRCAFFSETTAQMGLDLTQAHVEDYLQRDATLTSFVLGRDVAAQSWDEWAHAHLPSELDLQSGVTKVLRDELDALSRQIADVEQESDLVRGRAEEVRRERDRLVDAERLARAAEASMRRELDAMSQSTIWRATRPLRALVGRIKSVLN